MKLEIRWAFLWAALCCASVLCAQPTKAKPSKNISKENFEKIKAIEDTLGILAYAVVNDSIERERFAACRQLITGLSRALKVENSFQYKFDRLKTLSILWPPDSSFRVFTWQLYVNDSTYRYYGAIQRNSEQAVVFPLVDRSADMDFPLPTHEVLTPERWYGALYYTIRQFDTKEGRKYLLMGYDAFEFFEKRKLIDVLSFNKEGKPEFGADVFARAVPSKKGPEMRIFLAYSSEATVKCNWDELYGMILMDHLIPMGSPFGRGVTAVPDGSYDGFQWDKKTKKWNYIDKVFNDVQAEPPSVEPLSGEREKSKDLFGGRTKKKKKSSYP